MYTHDDIWGAIDRLAKISGYSTSGLAIKAGLDPTSFNKSKRVQPNGKARWPSMESISKILAVTNMAMVDFVALMQDQAPAPENSAASIPVLGFAQAGRAGFFSEDGAPILDKWGEVPLDHFNGDDYFALEINGDSMLPLYRDGDLIIVAQSERINKGDRAVFKLQNGEVMVKEVLKKNKDQFTLRSINRDYQDLTIPAADVIWCGRVAWVSQ